MSSIWYPVLHSGEEPTFEIAVDDPGYGRLWARRLDGRFEDAQDPERRSTGWQDADEPDAWFGGPDLLRLLDEVRQHAPADHSPLTIRAWDGGCLVIAADETAALLPVLIRAVLLAVAGGDRYERLAPDPDEAPLPPLCVRCNEGSPYAGSPTISAWCLEHGHTPFAAREHTSWKNATESAERERRWRELDRRNSPGH